MTIQYYLVFFCEIMYSVLDMFSIDNVFELMIFSEALSFLISGISLKTALLVKTKLMKTKCEESYLIIKNRSQTCQNIKMALHVLSSSYLHPCQLIEESNSNNM